jgi:NADPH-dependent ferric siderophore reductase
MTETPAPTRPRRRPRIATVLETRRLSPHLQRVVVGGEGLEGFRAGEFTDHYVKLHIPPPGAAYAAPFDAEDVKERHPRGEWPRVRTYTVREWDPEGLRLTLDFVIHGDEGVAGPWALAARPGDLLQFMGPGGAYTPSRDADWHLLVGDLAVVPAIAASLQRIPAGVPAHVILEVPGPEDEVELETPGDLHLTWLHGDGTGDALLEAVRALDFPEGQVHGFVHGEATVVRDIRRHLVLERGVPREALSASGYWKHDRDDEAWRAEKAEFNRRADEELEATASS